MEEISLTSLHKVQKCVARLLVDNDLLEKYRSDSAHILQLFGLNTQEDFIPYEKLKFFAKTLRKKKFDRLKDILPVTYEFFQDALRENYQRYITTLLKQGEQKNNSLINFINYLCSRSKYDFKFPRTLRPLVKFEYEDYKFHKTNQRFKICLSMYSISNVLNNVSLRVKYGPTITLWIRGKRKSTIYVKQFSCSITRKPQKKQQVLNKNSKVDIAHSTDGIAKNILMDLAQKKFSFVDKKLSLDEFYTISANLGYSIHYQDIFIEPGSEKRFLQAARLGYHTDAPVADLIGWYCIAQESHGHTLLVNCCDIHTNFTKKELNILSKLLINRPSPGKMEAWCHLLTKDKHHYKIYFHPWANMRGLESKVNQMVFRKFTMYINDSKRASSFLLKPGNACFINNKYVLHGRNALPVKTNRFLKRVWIAQI